MCTVAGEYISLYHHQRALLQQRESQKNEYISHLARDREEMQVWKDNDYSIIKIKVPPYIYLSVDNFL